MFINSFLIKDVLGKVKKRSWFFRKSCTLHRFGFISISYILSFNLSGLNGKVISAIALSEGLIFLICNLIKKKEVSYLES